jgi:hypothetical protein
MGVTVLLLSTASGPAAAQDVSTRSAATAPGLEVITLGADTEIFRDDFGAVGYWGVSGNDAGRIEYADGALRFSTTTAPDYRWTWVDLEAQAPVLWVRAAVDMAIKGGAAGPMCLTRGTSPSLLFGLVNTEGEWVVGRTMDDSLRVLARGPLPPSIDLTQGGRAIVSLECAMTGMSGGRVAVWVDGVNLADVSIPETVGPFSGPGLFGEGYVDGFEARIDDVVVATGTTYEPLVRSPEGAPPLPPASPPPASPPPASPGLASPAPSASAAASVAPFGGLTSHVPVAFSLNCTAAEADPSIGLLETIQCTPAGEVESAGYLRYDSVERLDSAFDGLLIANGAVTDGADCSVGPALVEYTIGDHTAGRLACYRSGSDALVQWSNRDLLVMGIGAESSGDFGTLFTWWQDAGPLP